MHDIKWCNNFSFQILGRFVSFLFIILMIRLYIIRNNAWNENDSTLFISCCRWRAIQMLPFHIDLSSQAHTRKHFHHSCALEQYKIPWKKKKTEEKYKRCKYTISWKLGQEKKWNTHQRKDNKQFFSFSVVVFVQCHLFFRLPLNS